MYRESNNDKQLRDWFTSDMTRSLLRGIDLREGQLRGLYPFSMPINYPIIAIAGKNGAGKSTLLALACCAFHNKRTGYKLKNRQNTYYTFSDFFIQHSEETPPDGITIYYKIAHNKWRPTKNFPEGVGIAHQKRHKRQGGRWNDYAKRVHSDVIFLGIQRIVPHSERSQSKSYSKAFKDVGMKGWEEKVIAAVGYVLGKKYNNLRYLEHSKYLLPIVECNASKYSGLNMGAGENALFEIFRLLYSCSSGTLLVIDEIELGLHIAAQRRLIRKLKKTCLERKIQIICTTHSRDIFDGLPPDGRKYIESTEEKTYITEGISSTFAMAKMGATDSKELEILLEDGLAQDIVKFALPTPIRQRLKFTTIGSASALSRQLAAIHIRNPSDNVFAIFDGDQLALESKNIKYATSLIENNSDRFADWFKERTSYLPGALWPEAWILQTNLQYISNLANTLELDEDMLLGIIEYGLQAGKHNEFHEIAEQLNLSTKESVQIFMSNLKYSAPEIFSDILENIKSRLKEPYMDVSSKTSI